MIKAVFFDIDDTLFDFTTASSAGMNEIQLYVQETLNVKKKEFQDAMNGAEKVVGARVGYDSSAFHNRQIRFQNAMNLLGKPIYPYATQMYKIYWNTVLEQAIPEKGLVNLLIALKERNIYLGIGTDMTSYIQNKKLEKMQIASYFDAVVTSEEAGIDKPGRKFFELCMEKAGCTPNECLFIGDHLAKDVFGPREFGMNSVWYCKYSTEKKIDQSWSIMSYQECLNDNVIAIGTFRI